MALEKKKKKKQSLEVNCLNVCFIFFFFGFRLTFVKNMLCFTGFFFFFFFSCFHVRN